MFKNRSEVSSTSRLAILTWRLLTTFCLSSLVNSKKQKHSDTRLISADSEYAKARDRVIMNKDNNFFYHDFVSHQTVLEW